MKSRLDFLLATFESGIAPSFKKFKDRNGQKERAIQIMKEHDAKGSTFAQIKSSIAYDLTIDGTTNEFISVAARQWDNQSKVTSTS